MYYYWLINQHSPQPLLPIQTTCLYLFARFLLLHRLEPRCENICVSRKYIELELEHWPTSSSHAHGDKKASLASFFFKALLGLGSWLYDRHGHGWMDGWMSIITTCRDTPETETEPTPTARPVRSPTPAVQHPPTHLSWISFQVQGSPGPQALDQYIHPSANMRVRITLQYNAVLFRSL